MTQTEFYTHFNVEWPTSKEQRLVKDLSDQGFDWQQIYDVFVCLESSPYDWQIKEEA
jgi:uncharacterized protein Smg (DUF494 family)